MITLKYIERYGFQMFIDDEHVGDICPSGDQHEWATYLVNGQGSPIIPRYSTTPDMLDALDDLENHYYTTNGLLKGATK